MVLILFPTVYRYRDLRCLRNTIHINLFLTYILSIFLWILTLSLQVRKLLFCNISAYIFYRRYGRMILWDTCESIKERLGKFHLSLTLWQIALCRHVYSTGLFGLWYIYSYFYIDETTMTDMVMKLDILGICVKLLGNKLFHL